jgi:proteic killer suppression protein
MARWNCCSFVCRPCGRSYRRYDLCGRRWPIPGGNSDEIERQFRGIARLAKRKLEALNVASRLEDLMVPPANRLEKLKGKLKDFYSIRDDQWRVIFKWIDGEAHEVRIVDYH